MSEPKISVIIPVRNEADKIEQCLKAVFAQSLKPYEVIVVDGHSTDETVEKARKFPVRVFFQDYGACGAARQIGLENAEGEYIAFTDADCIPSENWLRSLVVEFREGIIGVGGGIKNIGKGLWIRSINLAQDTFLGGASSVQTRLFKKKRFVKSISGCNSMYRKTDLVGVSGFNIHLSGADETELNRRLIKLKEGKLLYVPSAVVLHDHGRGLKEFAKNMYHYGGWRRECRVWDLPALPPLIAPFLFLTLIIGYWILPAIISLYLVIIGVMGLKFAIQEKDVRYLLSIPIIYLVEHLCYTIGFWKEVFRPCKVGEMRGGQPQ
jgi:glycosyltransferase involved in cell wall biosynthesis